MINSPNAMIVMFWSPVGFLVISTLPRKITSASKFFIDNILPDIVAAKPACDPD
jgi:hypothetical protein